MSKDYDFHPWFDANVAGYKITNKRGKHLYTVRMYAPDEFGAVRIELRDADNNLMDSKLISIFLDPN